MEGPGKYDGLCTLAREMAQADGAAVMIFNGALGSGFAVQGPEELTEKLPGILRFMADEMEADNKRKRT